MFCIKEKIKKKININFLYLIPAIIVLNIFVFFPLVKVLAIAFNSNYNKFDDSLGTKIGEIFSFKNFQNIFQEHEFRFALLNTLLLVLLVPPISLTFALLIALALNNIKNRFFKNTFKTLFFLPMISNTVIMGMIFSIVFYCNTFGIASNNPDGLFNSFIKLFGWKSQEFVTVTAPYHNKIFVLILYNMWARLPFKIFVFVLFLQDIDKSYYDAAKVDGASKWRIFYKITLPLIAPVIFYQFIIEMMAVFKEYESVVGLFGASHQYKIDTIVGYIYNQLSNTTLKSFSKGAAAAIVLFFASIFFTLIGFFVSKKTIK
ncbi:ABC-type sugar transport system permease protein [Candidatus Phytoplasma luffae]|uniref:ABC-type sugar transport system permease protein n=1 Tax=Loofah witches'-broom phytoplasma TaxID=35773 RepID=A0A975FIU9_LOWBP|nr:sugar ABC transporter permease [Candidatus Phytoplasma luffae]QTX03285.1 ABC-type sugar transport system permease protein [Candidatus Phytoplasma luffae]